MTSRFLVLAAASACTWAGAEELGRVLSSTPVFQQVAVPQQYCSLESVVVPGTSSGGGAVVGAITGAAIGHAVGRRGGHGGGRTAGTVIGMIGGAVIGDRLDSQSHDQVQQVRHCTTHVRHENRVVYHDVVYEYAGKSYAVQMPSDPGPTVRLQISPIGATHGTPQPGTVPGTYRTTEITLYQTIVSPPVYGGATGAVYIALPLLPYAIPALPQPLHRARGARSHRHHPHAAPAYPRHGGPRWR